MPSTYNAVSDFSLDGNPNGPWSYGVLSNITGGTFTPDTATLSNQNYPGQAAWWNGQQPTTGVVVDKNTSGITQQYFNTIVHPPNLLRLDSESLIADLRWTAPAAGAYEIAGLFQRIDTANQPVNVRIIEDGTTTLFAVGNFSTFNDQRPFRLPNVGLLAGDTLDFAEYAPDSRWTYDSTGVDATITLSTTAFQVTAPAKVQAGTPFAITVSALDASGRVDPDYTGTVHFTTSDQDPGVVLPADYTFTVADQGVHTFTDTGLGETTLITRGDQAITVTDTADGSIMGSITVKVQHIRHHDSGRGDGTPDGTAADRWFATLDLDADWWLGSPSKHRADGAIAPWEVDECGRE